MYYFGSDAAGNLQGNLELKYSNKFAVRSTIIVFRM